MTTTSARALLGRAAIVTGASLMETASGVSVAAVVAATEVELAVAASVPAMTL